MNSKRLQKLTYRPYKTIHIKGGINLSKPFNETALKNNEEYTGKHQKTSEMTGDYMVKRLKNAGGGRNAHLKRGLTKGVKCGWGINGHLKRI